jgi:hypothetical protein
MAKVPRVLIYGAVVVVAAATVLYTSPTQPSKSSIKVREPSKAAKKTDSEFKQEDFDARFARLNGAPKNSFMPIVAKRTGGGSGFVTPDSVPPELAGGDPNWVYTGTAIVDGVPTALLENRVTLEGEFVKQGQVWNRAKVHQILPEVLVLAGPTGRLWTLKLVEPLGDFEDNGAGELAPVVPQLRGPIGGEVTIRPERAQGAAARAGTDGGTNAN